MKLSKNDVTYEEYIFFLTVISIIFYFIPVMIFFSNKVEGNIYRMVYRWEKHVVGALLHQLIKWIINK